MTVRSPRSYSPVQRRRRPVHPNDRALEVVLNSTSVLLWVPYTLAAIYVAYCNAYFIESDYSSTSAVEWKARLLHTLTHSPPATAATTLLEHTRLSHRYNQFYYYIFPEGFDVIAFLPSLLYILSVSAIAIASTHFCAVHIEKGGEFLMVVAWILGVLSERWWLTSSSPSSAIVSAAASSSSGGASSSSSGFPSSQAEYGGALASSSSSSMMMMNHAGGNDIVTGTNTVPASTLLQGASLMVLYHAAIPTPPSWLWLVVSMLTGLLSGVLCKVKDIVEGKQDRHTHLFRWFNAHYYAPRSSIVQPARRRRSTPLRRMRKASHDDSVHSSPVSPAEARREAGQTPTNVTNQATTTNTNTTTTNTTTTNTTNTTNATNTSGSAVNDDGRNTAHSSRSNSPAVSATSSTALRAHEEMMPHSPSTSSSSNSLSRSGRRESVAMLNSAACPRPTRHDPIGLGERLYMVIPFCTGQWFHFIIRHGWRGIIIENGIIVLSLGMVGYTMLSYQLLKRQVRRPTRRTIRTTTVPTRSRPANAVTHAASTNDEHRENTVTDATSPHEGAVQEKNNSNEHEVSQGDDVELEHTTMNATTTIIEDEGGVVDLIDLIYRLFTTSFGVVAISVLALDLFLTSLAIPFIKALFSLDALVSSAGIIVELIVYDMI